MVSMSPVYVEAPPVTPLPFGLFSAALVLDETGPARFAVSGVQYQPDYCGPAYDSLGACDDPADDFGTLSVSVSNAKLATITATGAPTGPTYSIDWGDGTTTVSSNPDADTHTYGAAGDYVVVVTDDAQGYLATAAVHVVNSTASGPFAATVSFSKIASDGLGLVEGVPFIAYHLYTCHAVGGVLADGAARARRALQLGEGRAAERVVGRQLARSSMAVDLTPTPGTAIHPVAGLALLEEYAGDNYGGVPVLHTRRGAGVLLSSYGLLQRENNRLETKQGVYVSSGAGYAFSTPTPNPATPLPTPAAGTDWLYITGQVVVHRSAAIEVGPEMAGSRLSNEFSALAERPYAVTWECFVGAVLVDTTYGVPV